MHGVMTKGKSGHWAASLNGQHSKKQDTKGRLATGKWGSTVHCTVGLGAPLSKRGETRGEVTTGEGGGGRAAGYDRQLSKRIWVATEKSSAAARGDQLFAEGTGEELGDDRVWIYVYFATVMSNV